MPKIAKDCRRLLKIANDPKRSPKIAKDCQTFAKDCRKLPKIAKDHQRLTIQRSPNPPISQSPNPPIPQFPNPQNPYSMEWTDRLELESLCMNGPSRLRQKKLYTIRQHYELKIFWVVPMLHNVMSHPVPLCFNLKHFNCLFFVYIRKLYSV